MAVRQTRILRQLLELGARDEVVTFLARQYLEHLFRVGVEVELVKLAVRQWEDLLEEALLLDLASLLVGKCDHFDDV